MAAIDEIKAWFARDIKFATWDDNIRVDVVDPKKTEIRFYTDNNEYLLTLSTEENEGEPRVECVARARKVRAGHDTPRMRPLLPAARPRPLNQRVWRRILGAIVGLELVRVHRRGAQEKAGETAVASEESGAAA